MRVAHHLVLLSVSLRAAAAFVAVAPPRRTRVEAHYVRMLDASLATTAATEVAPLLEYPNLLSGVDTLWSDMFSICAIATLGLMGAYATQGTEGQEQDSTWSEPDWPDRSDPTSRRRLSGTKDDFD